MLIRCLLLLLLDVSLGVSSPLASAQAPSQVIVVVGASGSEEFEQPFREWGQRWQNAACKAQVDCTVIGVDKPEQASDRDQLQHLLKAATENKKPGPLWLVLLGHGTYDGKTARFGLRGPDLSSLELKEFLQPVERPLAVVGCFSCSGPFLAELSGPRRIILTSTKSGHEYNFSRFGDFLSTAIDDPAADLDKDEQTSLLEAYLAASSKLNEFYARDSRLVTEHALLDDNGDRLGTPADWFQGLRVVKQSKPGGVVDGLLARQFVLVPSGQDTKLSPTAMRQRTELEAELAALRARKGQVADADYFTQLELVLLKLARIADGKPVTDTKPGEARPAP